MKRSIKSVLYIVVLALLAAPCLAQVATGTPAFGSFAGGPDIINLGNLNAHWDLPIRNKAGRGMNFTYDVTYDSSIYYPVTINGVLTWQPVTNWGWNGLTPSGQEWASYSMTYSSGNCGQYGTGTYQEWQYGPLTYHDPWGRAHTFSTGGVYFISSGGTSCPPAGANPSGTQRIQDSTGLIAYWSVGQGVMTVSILNADGTITSPPVYQNYTPPTNPSSTTTDGNGNQISMTSGTYTDTLGQPALGIALTAPNTTQLSYQNPTGNNSIYTVTYSTQNIQTAFNCNVHEYSASSVPLVSSIGLPDGRSYQFSYEPTPGPGHSGYTTGRISSVILPTGGTISYQYTGGSNGILCGDGSTAGLNRTTPDGVWSYSRNQTGTTTTVMSPTYQGVQDKTVISFLPSSSDSNLYEIERQVYAGSSTLLETVLHCYEASSSACSPTTGDTGTRVTTPIQRIATTYQWPDSTGISSGVLDVYDPAGKLSSHEIHDYASGGSYGGLLAATAITYSTAYSTYGLELPIEVKTTDGQTPAHTVADTKYSYTTARTTTSGTPQHVSNDLTLYNVGSIQRLVSGSKYLTTSFTYYDTGMISTITDPNGTGVTTYSYNSNSCGNSFPTGTFTPVKNPSGTTTATLTSGAVWNCIGGVPSSATDANNNATYYSYGSDPYWRVKSVTDPAENVTSFSYPSNSSPNTSTSSLSFYNGNSVNNTVMTTDGLGRPILQQQQQGPNYGYFDSVALAFDSRGRLAAQTLPFTTQAGGVVTPPFSIPHITRIYDALDRPALVQDSGGGTIQYGYNGNDVLVIKGPAPSGENSKRKELEYNGAGQLTSVCEITGLGGSGSCGQFTSAWPGYGNISDTGYLTKYTYDAGNNLTQVQQNAQPGSSGVQTRSISYDILGRKISESIPEWSNGSGSPGTAAYTFDSDGSGTCTGSSAGDLIKSIDSAGNTTCYTYDSMHRVLSSRVVSGPYSAPSITPQAYFVYDAASYGTTAMQNVKGNLAEAYTYGCTGASCTPTLRTDEFFSYSLVTSGSASGGVLAQMWEKTPNSSTYFLTQDTLYPNGALASRTSVLGSAFYGYPNMSYGLDGEGRPYWASDATRCINPVTATSYNAAGAPTSVTFGNASSGAGADVDSFEYDANSVRPKALNYFVNAITNPFNVNTTLTWNANGSLKTMAYTDENDSSKNQNCSYSADDLSRVASVSCGSNTWVQTFTYDPFGNINKSGSISYTASYGTKTNQVTSGIVPTPQYDANGNQLTSTPANLSWNAWNVPISVSGTTATYDALGRMVETVSGGSATQFVFSPSGSRIALVQGGNLAKGTVPLPGGDTAIYSGTAAMPYIRHTDWLGSSRLATTWAHNVLSKVAYAPFGETYNEAHASGATPDRSFTGQDQDLLSSSGGTGVYDFLFRKYDPSAGRWLSPDPLGGVMDNPQTMNRYAYVLGNPVGLIDPLGLLAEGPGGGGDGGGLPGDPGSPPDGSGSCGSSGSGGGGGGGGDDWNDGWGDWGFGPPEVPLPRNGSVTGHLGIRRMGQNSCSKAGGGGGPNQTKKAPNKGNPETPACKTLRENAQELTNQVNHPFAWNGPQMTGAKIGFGIAIVGNAIVGCASGVLLTTAVTEGAAAPAAEATCTGGAIANSISPLAIASDLMTGGAGFVVAQYQLKDQAKQAWAQYEAACR